jgi:hypothetical protein
MKPDGLKQLPLAACLLALSACDRPDEAVQSSPEPAPAPAPGTTADSPPAAAPAPGLLTEVAAASGLGFVHFNGATGEYYQPEIFGPGLALLD